MIGGNTKIDVIVNYANLTFDLDEEFVEVPNIEMVDEYDTDDTRAFEFEAYGFYVGNHPSAKYSDVVKIKDIKVVETSGYLSDHYDPKGRVIRLSKSIYSESSVASVAVACHECGHAIQDKNNYTFLRIRSAMVPFVNLCT